MNRFKISSVALTNCAGLFDGAKKIYKISIIESDTAIAHIGFNGETWYIHFVSAIPLSIHQEVTSYISMTIDSIRMNQLALV